MVRLPKALKHLFQSSKHSVRSQIHFKFLADASKRLATSTDYLQAVREIVDSAVPLLTDYCLMEVIEDASKSPLRFRAYSNASLKEKVESLTATFAPSKNSRGVSLVRQTGKPELIDDVTDEHLRFTATSPEHLERLRDIGVRSNLCVPLKARGKVLGTISFATVRESGLSLDATDLSFAAELGQHIGLAIDNVRLLQDAEREIEERKKSQASLEAAIEVSKAANLAKSVFLANMSHEIRTPLGVILGFSEFLLNPQQSQEERIQCVNTIRRNGELLSHIVNDVLDLSKIEAGHIEIENRTFAFGEFIDDLATHMSFKAQEKGIAFSLEQRGRLPRVIRSDHNRLKQILKNVIGNAIKFTAKGHVRVVIEAVHSEGLADGQVELKFDVEDTGPGLTSDQASKLFQPFVQADSSARRKFGGTGLGLALSQKLARTLGGNLVLSHSVVGKGSVFTTTVLAYSVEPMATEVSLERKAPQKVSVLSMLAGRLHGLNVLLVEDSPDNQVLVSRFLQKAGASVCVAENGYVGIEKAMERTFDVILMDIQMPGLDGHETAQVLRQRGFEHPMIALTAHALKCEREKAFEAGFDDFLTKPVSAIALVDSILAQLERKEIRPQLSQHSLAFLRDDGNTAASL